MKSKYLLTLLLGATSLVGVAQTHQEGIEYYKADQLKNAKELLQRNMNNPGTDKSLSDYYLGMIAMREGNKAEALKCFEAGVAANAENAYNYVGLGYLQLLNKQVKEAETNFKLADKLGKKDGGVAVAIARAYNDADAVAYAKQINKYLEKARNVSKMQEPDIYLFEGDVLKAQKDFGGAAAKYEMASTYDPTSAEAYVKYADLFTMVNPQYAIKMLNRLLDQNPQSALGQRELANAYYNNQDFKSAAQQYGKYVNNPNHFKQDEDRYAFLLFYGGNFKDGYEYATRLLKENPNNFTARRYQFMNAANLAEMEPQLLGMAEDLYKAHMADKEENLFAAIDYTLIADEMKKAGRYDEAVEVLNEAMTEMPENAAFDRQLSFLYVSMDDFQKAAEAYVKYADKLPNAGVNEYNQIARFYQVAGSQAMANNPAVAAENYSNGLVYAEKAAKASPDFYLPKKIIGDILVRQSSDDRTRKTVAIPTYTEALALIEANPNDSYVNDAKEMCLYLGNAYVNLDDNAKGKVYYSKYLQYAPNDAAVLDYMNKLK